MVTFERRARATLRRRVVRAVPRCAAPRRLLVDHFRRPSSRQMSVVGNLEDTRAGLLSFRNSRRSGSFFPYLHGKTSVYAQDGMRAGHSTPRRINVTKSSHKTIWPCSSRMHANSCDAARGFRRSGAGDGRIEAVANAANASNIRSGVSQFLSQSLYVGIHGARRDASLVAPDIAKKGFARLHARPAVVEGAEKAELEGRKVRIVAVHEDAVGRSIDRQGTDHASAGSRVRHPP